MTIGRIPSVEGGIQPTIVDAKGDILTATAADTPAVLAVGNNGETLVADSSQSTGLRWGNNYGFTAGKNKLINGDFRINQRNFTSVTANDTYTFDRWASALSGGTVTYTPQTFTAGTAPVAGYEGTNFIRIVTSGQTSTNYAQILQKIEGVRTFAGQTVTLSFWAKAGSGTPLITAAITQLFGSGGSSAVGTNASGNQTLSTSWARYSFTFAIPSISGKTIGDASNALWVAILVSDGGGAGSTLNTVQNGTFDIWGVQLEAGSVATAFQTATGTLAGELAACCRYYQTIRTVVGAAASWTPVPFTVAFRTNPTVAGGGSGFVVDDAQTNVGNFYQTSRAYQTLTLSAEL